MQFLQKLCWIIGNLKACALKAHCHFKSIYPFTGRRTIYPTFLLLNQITNRDVYTLYNCTCSLQANEWPWCRSGNLDITNVRLQVVPFFLRDRWARETRARVKTTPREKGETRRGVRKIRDCRQSPSFWTLIYVALTTQNSGGSSVAICQHLSKTHQPLSTLDIITIYVRI